MFAVSIIALIGFSIPDAHATSFTAVVSGDWNDPATWGGMVPLSSDTATIPSGITVTIPTGLTVTVDSIGTIQINSGGTMIIANLGTIQINSGGTMSNDGTITVANLGTISTIFGSTLTNAPDGTITIDSGGGINNGSTINNSGNIDNSGFINNTYNPFNHNHGTINNLSGGTITINSGGTIENLGGATIINSGGTITINSGGIIGNTNGIITNSGYMANSGTINNSDTINNNSGGTITNNGTIVNNLFHYINNYGVMINAGTITNSGNITSTGSITVSSGGIINNTGNISISSSNLTVNSGGVINNNSGGTLGTNNVATIYNYGTIANNSGATITNFGIIKNFCGGVINNTGIISGNSIIDACIPNTVLTMSANATTVLQGKAINFTYNEQNTGNVALTSPTVTDNSCSPVTSHVNFIGFNVGDTNRNGMLDPSENWVFQCIQIQNTVGSFTHTATGDGIDPLGNHVTAPAYPSEQTSLSITVNHMTVTTGAGIVTFTTNNGYFVYAGNTGLNGLQAPDGTYPYGLFEWIVIIPSNSCPQITLTFPNQVPAGSQWIKMIGHNPVIVPIIINGNAITMTICDNQAGDANPTLGVISDPGGLIIPTDGRVNGVGDIAKNTDFSFAVRSDSDSKHSPKGTLDFEDKSAKIKLHSDGISFLSVDQTMTGTAFIGKADLDKHKGDVIVLVSVTDPDKTGNHDTFTITITDSSGKIYSNSGTIKGHIEIHKFADKDDKSDSGKQDHDNNKNK